MPETKTKKTSFWTGKKYWIIGGAALLAVCLVVSPFLIWSYIMVPSSAKNYTENLDDTNKDISTESKKLQENVEDMFNSDLTRDGHSTAEIQDFTEDGLDSIEELKDLLSQENESLANRSVYGKKLKALDQDYRQALESSQSLVDRYEPLLLFLEKEVDIMKKFDEIDKEIDKLFEGDDPDDYTQFIADLRVVQKKLEDLIAENDGLPTESDEAKKQQELVSDYIEITKEFIRTYTDFVVLVDQAIKANNETAYNNAFDDYEQNTIEELDDLAAAYDRKNEKYDQEFRELFVEIIDDILDNLDKVDEQTEAIQEEYGIY